MGRGHMAQGTCLFRILDSSVPMVQAAKHRMCNNVSEPLDWALVGERPSRAKREFGLHYSRKHILQEFVEGALR
jgi:hypothetical protein